MFTRKKCTLRYTTRIYKSLSIILMIIGQSLSQNEIKIFFCWENFPSLKQLVWYGKALLFAKIDQKCNLTISRNWKLNVFIRSKVKCNEFIGK